MTREELRNRIKVLVKTVYKDRASIEKAAVEYDELTKFPELKDVIVDLLGPQFDAFVASIDWVAPKPIVTGNLVSLSYSTAAFSIDALSL